MCSARGQGSGALGEATESREQRFGVPVMSDYLDVGGGHTGAFPLRKPVELISEERR